MTNLPSFALNTATPAAAPAAAMPGAFPGGPVAPSAPAMEAGGFGAAIAGAISGDRAPVPAAGSYTLEIVGARIATHPVKYTKTYLVSFKIVESSNPSHPVGSTVAYVEGMQYGLGRIQDFILNAAGFGSKASFDQGQAAAGADPFQALAAICDAAVKEEGNPLIGRHVAAVVSERSAKNKEGVERTFAAFDWSPAG